MSVKQLEAAVEKLNGTELAEFRDWFLNFDGLSAKPERDELHEGIRDELAARLDALDADPSLSVPWEGTMMSAVEKIREKLRTQNASDRRI